MFNPAAIPPKTRKHLSFDPLIKQIRLRAERLPDSRRGNDCTYAVADAVMSAIALFAMKDPSLLAFQERRNDANMKNIFRIPQVPSDTRMRELLDPLEPNSLRPMFNDVLRELQRGKALEAFDFLEGYNLLSLDGSGYYSSKKVHCEHCLQRTNSKTGEITYHHQMLGAALVHPDLKQVIPLAPDAIIKQDGENKNDCERNASKRLLQKIRDEHPHKKLIVVEDGLASNAPHIRLLKRLNMRFILGAKPDDHEHLFGEVAQAEAAGRVTTLRWTDDTRKVGAVEEVTCEIRFVNQLSPTNLRSVPAIQHRCVGELSAIHRAGVGRLDSQTLQLGHRSDHHSGQRASSCPRRSLALEDRKRNVQHAQESGLSVRAQLWSWHAEFVDELRDVDDVGISG
jgi:hypothetical protein